MTVKHRATYVYIIPVRIYIYFFILSSALKINYSDKHMLYVPFPLFEAFAGIRNKNAIVITCLVNTFIFVIQSVGKIKFST